MISPATKQWVKPRLEILEDRCVPAGNITAVPLAAGERLALTDGDLDALYAALAVDAWALSG